MAHTTGHAACCFCFGPVRMALVFLSTPSARRATPRLAAVLTTTTHFYPRPPRGGRPAHHNHAGLQRENFYPRPPRGGRRSAPYFLRVSWIFLSTPSMRRATLDGRAAAVFHLISIHALREEGDKSPIPATPQFGYFYPRPPRGGRHAATLTLRAQIISIHALREEGDPYREQSLSVA